MLGENGSAFVSLEIDRSIRKLIGAIFISLKGVSGEEDAKLEEKAKKEAEKEALRKQKEEEKEKEKKRW